MGIVIETPEGQDALTEFVLFADVVGESREVRWPALLPMQLPFLLGESPMSHGRTIKPLVARDGGEVVARCCAIVDRNYIEHWKEPLGHIALFEALPGTLDATRQLIDAASEWLWKAGMTGARAGLSGAFLDMPFALDEYATLPPLMLRQNGAHYHSLLKDAGFESEKGCVDYKIRVTPELVARYEAAAAPGYEIVPLADVPQERVAREFADTFNDAFAEHFGFAPFTYDEAALLLEMFGEMGALDTSVMAYKDGAPAGCLFVLPPVTAMAVGRPARSDEDLNCLGIGVLKQHRGRGVNIAMASHAYLKLIERGSTWLSYTLVLDDNWPSRRTAEKLGATVCANYMVYRRNFSR